MIIWKWQKEIYLRLKELLTVTHKQALEKAHSEYEKYKKKQEDTLSPVEQAFIESICELRKIEEKY